ncbi:hypothetical protein [Actinomadura rugatobispora]|uniref:LppX_LprAFG lipoprotein n=1 Tax=Actinomadura rugatobispora TaxID=1994 RepID=A0ABW1AHU3_9ACTN|nr:hypothetical protein GCM10010200_053830 [Actinomadura rugatobispora]
MGPPGPGMGMGMAPPPKRGGSGALIAILLGGGLVVVLLIVVVVVVVVASGGKSPEERLTAAANSLTTARSLKLKGSFSAGSDSLQGELTVTRGGRAGGQVSWGGTSLTLLSADQKLYVKAPKSYWQSKVTTPSSDRFLKDGEQWGRIDSSDLSLDINRELTPSALASDLRQAIRSTLRETETTVQGRKAIKLSSLLTSFYLSDDDQSELLRYETTGSPRVSADVTVQSTAASSASIGQLRGFMGELTDSFDTSAVARNRDKPEFVSCNRGGEPCTVRVKVWSPLSGSSSVLIRVNFRLTSEQGGGRVYGECESSGTVTGVSDVSVQCTISGGDWAKHGKNARRVWVAATPVAIAATSGDVQTMQRNLDSE